MKKLYILPLFLLLLLLLPACWESAETQGRTTSWKMSSSDEDKKDKKEEITTISSFQSQVTITPSTRIKLNSHFLTHNKAINPIVSGDASSILIWAVQQIDQQNDEIRMLRRMLMNPYEIKTSVWNKRRWVLEEDWCEDLDHLLIQNHYSTLKYSSYIPNKPLEVHEVIYFPSYEEYNKAEKDSLKFWAIE